VGLGEEEGVSEGEGVIVAVGVSDGVGEEVSDGEGVNVAVGLKDGVRVEVGVREGTGVEMEVRVGEVVNVGEPVGCVQAVKAREVIIVIRASSPIILAFICPPGHFMLQALNNASFYYTVLWYIPVHSLQNESFSNPATSRIVLI
jgi:hypothetical protein